MPSKASPPWQYRWKRPEIHPVIVDETLHLGHLSDLEKEQLTQMKPVQSLSAHLTLVESQNLLQTLYQRHNYGKTWTDIDQLLEKYDFMMAVTLLSSLPSDDISLIQKSNQSNLADAMLFELITCTEDDDNDSPKTDVSNTSIRRIYSKLMYWPSSILTNDSTSHKQPLHIDDEENLEDEISTRGDDDTSYTEKPDVHTSTPSIHPSSTSQPFWVSLGKTFLPFLPSNNNLQSSNRTRVRRSRFKGIISASLCRRKLKRNEEASKQEEMENVLQVLHLMNLGLPTTTLDDYIKNDFVKEHSTDLYIDHHSGIQGLPFVDKDENPKDTNTFSIVGQQRLDDVVPQDDELLLAFLSNNGKLYFFSILELFHGNDSYNVSHNVDEYTAPNHHISENSMSDAFESLLLGSQVYSQLQSVILPLTKPKATVILSLSLKNLGRHGDLKRPKLTQGNTREGYLSADFDNYGEKSSSHKVSTHSSQRPSFLDLTSFDATLDYSTIKYKTYKNQGTICQVVFDNIIIGGKGHRSIIRSLETTLPPIVPEEDDGKSVASENDHVKGATVVGNTMEGMDIGDIQDPLTKTSCPNHHRDSSIGVKDKHAGNVVIDTKSNICYKSDNMGGFISIVSLQYFSEVRTFFLPFIPSRIYPMTIQETQFILIIGFNLYECIAIQLDAWSEIADVCKSACDSNSDTAFESKTIVLKYEMLDVSFTNPTADDYSLRLLPIGVVMNSLNETCIICADPSGLYFCAFEGISNNCSSSYPKKTSHRSLIFQRNTRTSVYEKDFHSNMINQSSDGFAGFIGGQVRAIQIYNQIGRSLSKILTLFFITRAGH